MTKVFNLKTLSDAVATATRHALDHEGRIASYKARETAIRHEIQNSMAMLDGPARVQAERIYGPELDKRIRALRTETDKARWHFPREIEAIRAAAAEMKEHLTRPIKIATVANLGSEKRTNYERTVSGLQARALATMAKQASATGDKELASACILENDKLPTNDRAFSSTALANELFGADSETAQKLYKTLEFSFDKSMALLRDSEGRKMTGTELITSGMKYPGTRLIPDNDESEESEGDNRTPNQLMAAGMANR